MKMEEENIVFITNHRPTGKFFALNWSEVAENNSRQLESQISGLSRFTSIMESAWPKKIKLNPIGG